MKINFFKLFVIIIGLFLIFPISGCGSAGGGSTANQPGSASFTPYPPMPGQPAAISNQPSGSSKDAFTISLPVGWTTISFPFNKVLTTGNFSHEIQYWDGAHYQPINPATNAPSINCALGYWAYQDVAAVVQINPGSGDPIHSAPLTAGWNLIGFPSQTAKNFADLTLTFQNQTKPLTQVATLDTTLGSQWLYGNILYYKKNRWYTLRYDRAGTSALAPGTGYWIYSWKSGMTLDFVPPTRNEGPWVKTWGTEDYEFGTATATDSDGNIYAAGQGNGYSYLLKYSPEGELLWQKGWGGNKFAAAWAVTCDNLGNIYMGGDCNIGGSRLRAFLVKFDSDGNILWERTWLPDDGWARISALGVDSEGNIVGAGYTNGWEEDVLIIKYDTDGNMLWADSWGDSGSPEAAYGLTLDGQDNIYIAGYYGWPYGDTDALLLVMDKDGNQLADKVWGTQTYYPDDDYYDYYFDYAYAVALDSQGNIYLAGNDGLDYGCLLLKYDPEFNLLWQKSWTDGYFAQGQTLKIGPQDKIYIGAQYYTDYGSSMVLLGYDADGTLAAQTSWHSDSTDETIRGMSIDQSGNLYLQGYVYSAGNRWQPETGVQSDLVDTFDDVADCQPVPILGTATEIQGFGIDVYGVDTFAGGTDNVLVKYIPDYVPTQPRVTLLSLSPDSGTPGATVTIAGSNLGDQPGSVTFAGYYATILTWGSAQIICLVPANVPLGEIQVIAANNGDLSDPLVFTVLAPQLTGLSESAGVAGDIVTISGANFSADGTVSFGSSGAQIISWAESRIVCRVPAQDSAGEVQVSVTSCGHTSNSLPYTVYFPAISGISPSSGGSGIAVTIDGTNFGSSQGTVTFGGFSAGISSWNDSRVICSVPSTTPAGETTVQLHTANDSPSNEVPFTVLAPQIDSLSPTHGEVGTTVTVSGARFSNQQGTIKIADLAMEPTSWSDTQIVCVVPQMAVTGVVSVIVSGQGSNLDKTFTVDAPPGAPVVDDVNPQQGNPGDTVTITGSGFDTSQGTAEGLVSFGGQDGGTATSWCDTQIMVLVPTGGISRWILVTVHGHESGRSYIAAAAHVPNNLLCHFDENCADSTGRHWVSSGGINTGDPKWGSGCLTGGCYTDASNDWDLMDSEHCTMDFWLKIEPWVSVSSTTIMAQLGADDNGYWGWYLDLSVHYSGSANSYLFVRNFPWGMDKKIPADGKWHHISLVRNGEDAGCSLDGSFWSTGNLPIHSAYSPGAYHYSYIGISLPDGVEIDDLRICNSASFWIHNFTPPQGPANTTHIMSNPYIDDIYPLCGAPGTLVTISGVNFGDSQEKSAVNFFGADAGNALYWSDDEIVCEVPENARTGSFSLIVDGWLSKLSTIFEVNFGFESNYAVYRPVYLPSTYSYRTWSLPLDHAYITDQAMDSQGNVYILGRTYSGSIVGGSLSKDTFIIAYTFLIKYDNQGRLVWQKAWYPSDSSWTDAKALALDKNGNILIAGRFNDPDYNYYVYLVKFQQTGSGLSQDLEPLWQEKWTLGGDGQVSDLCTDAAGNAYLTGTIGGNLYVTKFTSSGVQGWQKYWSNCNGNSIAAFQNAIYVAGENNGMGSQILKLDALQGTLLWHKLFYPTDYDNFWNPTLQKIKLDNLGDIYALGTVDIPFGDYDSATIASICKFDSNGNLCSGWPQAWQNTAQLGQQISDLALDKSGNVYLTGYVSIGSGRHIHQQNVLLVKYDCNGNLLGQKAWNKDYADNISYGLWMNYGIGINVDSNGNILLGSTITDKTDPRWYPYNWTPGAFETLAGQSLPMPIDLRSDVLIWPLTMSSSQDDIAPESVIFGDAPGIQTYTPGSYAGVLLQRMVNP